MSEEKPRSKSDNDSKPSVRSASPRQQCTLLRKVINNKIMTMRLYYAMLFLGKWRVAAQRLKEDEAIVLVQRLLKGCLARKQAEVQRQYQSAKVAIYNKVVSSLGAALLQRRKATVRLVLGTLLAAANSVT